MRKNWKKLVSLVLTAACTMVVTVAPVFADAASTPAYSPVEASTVDSLLSSSVQWVGQSLMTYSDDDLANMEASDQQFYARAAEAWEEAKADLGEVKSLEDGTLEVDGDFVTCTIPGEFEKNPGIVRVFWNISTGTPVPTDLTITVEESKGVLIGQAGMNTIIGIGTVFVMLIFLIFVISSFDYILGDKKKKKAPAAPIQEAPKAVAAPVVEETAPEADDMELQAVITAAIAMYEEDMASASGDAYVARPIRRKGKKSLRRKFSMKNYTITVNGNVYNVTVEEGTTAGAAPVVSAAKAAPAPKAAPAAPKAAAPAGAAGSVEVTASVPGKICKIEAAAGTAVKAGDAVLVLEAMKMEIPVVAPQDGTVATINVAVGDAVESGDVLATMN